MEYEEDLFERILKEHWERYPLMEVQDLYKLLHQAALGSEHAVPDEATARQRLEEELAEMGEGPIEPPIDLISPDRAIVRVHLRAWLRAEMDFEVVLKAFLRTAKEWGGSAEMLSTYGQAAVQQAKREKWNLRGVDIEAFFATMEVQGYPAVHHSAAYANAYHPAYRVLKRKFLINK